MARMTIVVAFVVLSVLAPVTRAQDIEKDWTSFLHYAAIGRFDMAVAHGNSILQAQPQPAQMFRLSEENPRGYAALLDMKARSRNEELVDIAGRLLNIIDRGRYERRSDVTVISEEINRLSTTARGRLTAVERLRDAGEYAVPLMLSALADDARKDQFANIAGALGQMDKHAVRPLVAALQTSNAGIKAEIIRALGEIRSPQALPYLKYVVETSRLPTLVSIAANSVNEIDPAARNVSAADLFVSLARSYYNHSDALAPATDGTNANIWFWDDTTAQLTRVPVDIRYFNELMAMRACEWALRADPAKGDAIGIWLAAYFKAESTGLPMPPYFGENYADAATYATIVGPEYVQHALAMALADGNVYMMLGLINALSATGGEASMMRATGDGQPLIRSLYHDDRQVRFSAAIAIAAAEPKTPFADSRLVVQLLGEALSAKSADDWPQETADLYAARALAAMHNLAIRGNKVLDPAMAAPVLINAAKDPRRNILTGSLAVLSLIDSPDAQRAIAAVALADINDQELTILGFEALADSAKAGGNLLLDETVEAIYKLVQSDQTPPAIRSAAATAYGALNLPSDRARRLLLDQAKS